MGKSYFRKRADYLQPDYETGLYTTHYRPAPGLTERERRMAGNMYLQMRHMYQAGKRRQGDEAAHMHGTMGSGSVYGR